MDFSSLQQNPLSVNCIQTNSFVKSETDESLFLHPFVPVPIEFLACKRSFSAFTDLNGETCRDQDTTQAKSEFLEKAECKYENLSAFPDIKADHCEMSQNKSIVQEHLQLNLKAEISRLLRFLLSNMGKDNQIFIENTRNYYLGDSDLLEVYNKLIAKYYSAKKSKEDILRYIFRKIFRSKRTQLQKEKKVSSKQATILLFKEYFPYQTPQYETLNEEEFLESLFAFKKNFKNSTVNLNFILEIFKSKSFLRDYQEFLPEFYSLVIEENKKREDKLALCLIECVENKTLEKFSKFHRFPWLDIWIEDARNLAIAIMPNKRLIINDKKPKI